MPLFVARSDLGTMRVKGNDDNLYMPVACCLKAPEKILGKSLNIWTTVRKVGSIRKSLLIFRAQMNRLNGL